MGLGYVLNFLSCPKSAQHRKEREPNRRREKGEHRKERLPMSGKEKRERKDNQMSCSSGFNPPAFFSPYVFVPPSLFHVLFNCYFWMSGSVPAYCCQPHVFQHIISALSNFDTFSLQQSLTSVFKDICIFFLFQVPKSSTS